MGEGNPAQSSITHCLVIQGWAKLGPDPVFVFQKRTEPGPFLSIAAFELKKKKTTATETILSVKLKVLTIYFFTQKFCQPLGSNKLFSQEKNQL